MRSRMLFVALLVLAAAPGAYAQEPWRHEGLFLRLEGGVGFLSATANDQGATSTASGGAGYLGAALGGAIGENLVLYGEIWGMGAPNPNIQIGASNTIAQNTTLNYGGVGLGLGYFFMPSNLFLGVSLDATRLGVTDSNGTQSDSDIGAAASLTLGKQWWISERTGLGLSLKCIGGGNSNNNNDPNSTTFKTVTGLVTVTLTYG